VSTTQVGIDLCGLADVEAAVDRFGDRYLQRVYTDDELAYCNAGGSNRFGRLAARFAAKEAALKALRAGDAAVPWTDVEVTRRVDGAPGLCLSGAAAALAAAAGVGPMAVSMAHEGDLASAVVIAEGTA
jgi:holo-[acyl-carrier protein] synthase